MSAPPTMHSYSEASTSSSPVPGQTSAFPSVSSHRSGAITAPTNLSEQRTSFSRQQRPHLPYLFDRERENSTGGWSASSVGTGTSFPSSSAHHRTMSKRLARGMHPNLAGSSLKKKRDKHSAALISIREFLKGRSCYDCLPVSFRLVVLDTKLVVKPALDVMWQAGVVSAPLWQSTSQPKPLQAEASTSTVPTREEALSPSALSARLAASELSEPFSPLLARSPSTGSPSGQQEGSASLHSALEATTSTLESVAKRATQQTSAPAPGKAGFAGMLTVNDIIHLIQYYYQHSNYDNAAQDVERFRLEMLREIEQTLHVPQPPLLSLHPLRPVFEACQLLVKTHARRLPLLDYDEQIGMEAVVSVLTQYRVLKFIAMNCRETAGLNRTLRSLGIGTYVAGTKGVGRSNTVNAAPTSSARGSVSSSRRSSAANTSSLLSPPPAQSSGMAGDASAQPLSGTSEGLPALEEVPAGQDSPAFSPSPFFSPSRSSADTNPATPAKPCDPIATATLDTTVFDVVHVFSEKGISAIPILDEEGYVVDLYETVDVIDLVRSGAYQSLDLTIRQALSRRSKDFPGVMTCGPDDTLANIFTLLRTKRVHRLLIMEPESTDEDEKGPLDVDESIKTSAEAIKNDPLAGLGEIKQRKRGKLIGILCLSDILKYITGGKTSILEARAVTAATAANTSTTTNPTASTSLNGVLPIAIGDNISAGTSAAGDVESSVPSSMENVEQRKDVASEDTTARLANGGAIESGPRPVDMPPTIAEHPKETLSHPSAETAIDGQSQSDLEQKAQAVDARAGTDASTDVTEGDTSTSAV